MGPQNGGVTEQSKAEYSDLLKLWLSSVSLRWFMDTYLTAANLKELLGEDSPAIVKLKTEWYCFKIMGCKQDNSHFPIILWIKKLQFWQEEALEDGVFKTMIESMSTPPMLVYDGEETQQGPRNSQRKHAGIDLYCKKTHGCKFITKHQKALNSHEKSCRPKAIDLVCKVQGCEFVTVHKSAMTNHVKRCTAIKAANEVAAQPEIVQVFACSHRGCRMTHPTKTESLAHHSTHTAKPDIVQVFACLHRGCRMTHPTKTESLAHHRTHTETKPNTTPQANPKQKPKATSKKGSESDKEESSEDTNSDDGKKEKVKRKGASTKPSTVAEPAPVADLVAVTKQFRCPFPGCDKSHATSELAQSHQRKHREPTSSSLEGAAPGMYLCPECPKSHATAELARRHQYEHQALRSPLLENEIIMCPECQVYRGTGAQVVAHMPACREALTCPVCHKKCSSQALLIVHVLRCPALDAGSARKRPREDDENYPTWPNWRPTRSRNNKNEVRLHWQKKHVQDWLVLVELEEYGPSFSKENVDGRILLQLAESAIKDTKVFGMKETHAAKFLELRDAFN